MAQLLTEAQRAVKTAMFHVKRRPACSFADAEVAEDHGEDVLHVDPAGQAPQGARGETQLLGDDVLAATLPLRQRSLERRDRFAQRLAVALPGHEARLGLAERRF